MRAGESALAEAVAQRLDPGSGEDGAGTAGGAQSGIEGGFACWRKAI